MTKKADSDLVRRQNRHLVLEALRFAGKAPRIELGRLTGLSLATITSITTQLLNEKLLVEDSDSGQVPFKRGRPSVDLRLNPEAALVMAMKISIDKFELALTGYSGNRVAHEIRTEPTYNLPADEAARRASRFILDFLKAQNLEPARIHKIGIAVQGAVESGIGHLMWSPAFKAQDIPLVEPIKRLTGITCELANDANMIAEGLMAREHYQYKGTTAVIFTGYGVGMGLVIDGKTYHGATGAAAEFGHMNHIPHGALCRCGRAGCLEAYASDYGILRHAEGLPDSVPPPLNAVEPSVMAALETAARRGDKNALGAYQNAGEAIGYGLARMIAILNPDRIMISGPGLKAFDLIEPSIMTAIAEGVVPALRSKLKIETMPMDHDMIMSGTLDKLLHELDREVFSRADH
ncbi:ROK family protein [Aestuariivirga litoralis]|uniref:ROK family protein n=1 Tax=Aestuariivirga litoralis TaxID=2650924 RepID=UPI0018C56034|nr:ROK family protein [Aestuariivirga litoralis]